jgi:aspartate aminotransferase
MTGSRKNIELTDSATVEINSLAQQKADAGIHVFNLSAGEPKLPPHQLIVEAVSQALAEGKIFYPPVSGVPELKELAAKDEVIIASPYWVSYPAITKLFGGVPVIIKTQEDEEWKLSAEQLNKTCTPKSKILILNNAANPTGTVYTKQELAALLDVAKAHNLFVISDEVYSGLIYDHKHYVSCGEFSEHQDQVVIIQSCSKNFSMTGWRIGFVFASSILIKKLTSLVSQSTSGVTTISQWAAVAVLKQVDTINAWVKSSMEQRRNVLIHAINEAFALKINPPSSALYIFVSLDRLGVKSTSSVAFCKSALELANVALVPGLAFGQEGFVRISFGASEHDLQQGISALADFCKNTF